jgi:hypothetical protein
MVAPEVDATSNVILERTKELERLLSEERACTRELTATVEKMRSSTAALLNTCEQAQEGVTNRLIREISRLKHLQLEMCDAVEVQEARLVGVLEDRLRTLQSEKVQMENALECEQERIVNHLQRQMDELKFSVRSGTESCPPANLAEQINLAVAQHIEREAELNRQITRLQEESQALLVENLRMTNKLRRQSIEESPIVEPLSPSLSTSSRRSRGSISELHLAPRREQQND